MPIISFIAQFFAVIVSAYEARERDNQLTNRFVTIGSIAFLLFVCILIICYRRAYLKKRWADAQKTFRGDDENAVRRRRLRLILGGVGLVLFVYGLGLSFRGLYGLSDDEIWYTGMVDEVANALLDLFLDAWIMHGLWRSILRLVNSFASPEDSAALSHVSDSVERPVERFNSGRTVSSPGSSPASNRYPLLKTISSDICLGFALNYVASLQWIEVIFTQYETGSEGYFEPWRQLVNLAWSLVVATLLLGEGAGVGIWAATFRLFGRIIEFTGVWAFGWVSGNVK